MLAWRDPRRRREEQQMTTATELRGEHRKETYSSIPAASVLQDISTVQHPNS